jgi:hypothetical protein
VPVFLELDELIETEGAIRFLSSCDGGLIAPTQRALSKIVLARELATAPSGRRRIVTLEGEVRGVEEDELELADGVRLPMQGLLALAGRADFDPERLEWVRGRVRLTLEVLA